jgi:transposase-like protein
MSPGNIRSGKAATRFGFCRALREVFPETREARCWFHKIANVLAALPKSAQPGAKKALAEIWNAEDKNPRPRCGRGVS